MRKVMGIGLALVVIVGLAVPALATGNHYCKYKPWRCTATTTSTTTTLPTATTTIPTTTTVIETTTTAEETTTTTVVDTTTTTQATTTTLPDVTITIETTTTAPETTTTERVTTTSIWGTVIITFPPDTAPPSTGGLPFPYEPPVSYVYPPDQSVTTPTAPTTTEADTEELPLTGVPGGVLASVAISALALGGVLVLSTRRRDG